MLDPTTLLTSCPNYNLQEARATLGDRQASIFQSHTHTHTHTPLALQTRAQCPAAPQASRLACPRWPPLATKHTGTSGSMSLSRWYVGAGRAKLPTEARANTGLGLGTMHLSTGCPMPATA